MRNELLLNDFTLNTDYRGRENHDFRLPDYLRDLLQSIWKLNRVTNSDDFEKTLNEVKRVYGPRLRGQFTVHRFSPGQSQNYWTVPRRRNVRRFRLIGPDGSTIATEADHPLVVCPFSVSTNERLELSELKKKIISREDKPSSYIYYGHRMYRHWDDGWNISLPHQVVESLPDGQYQVDIDVEVTDEPMPVIEYVLPGKTDRSIMLVAHICHPGQVNDSLSGCISCLQVIEALEKENPLTHYTYRILLVPEVIGSNMYLGDNGSVSDKIEYVVCTNLTSHDAPLALCLSKSSNSLMDLALSVALKEHKAEHVVGPFNKYPDCGDEICFDSVGYRIPSSTISRVGKFFRYYHTSDDDLEEFLRPECQERHGEFCNILISALRILESNFVIRPTFRGVPCLSHPDLDLYLSPSNVNNAFVRGSMLTGLDGNQIDGRYFMEFFLDALDKDGVSTLEIAHAANFSFAAVEQYARAFVEKGLAEAARCERIYSLPTVSTIELGTALA